MLIGFETLTGHYNVPKLLVGEHFLRKFFGRLGDITEEIHIELDEIFRLFTKYILVL